MFDVFPRLITIITRVALVSEVQATIAIAILIAPPPSRAQINFFSCM